MAVESIVKSPKNLGDRLWTWKNQEKYCDAALLVNGQRIPVHTLVLASFNGYFEKTFASKENSTNEITFNDVNLDVMQSLVEYCYKGSLNIKKENALDMFRIANILEISEIVEMCVADLKNNLNSKNCLTIWKAANMFNHEELKNFISPFVKDIIDEISQSDEYKSLEYSDIKPLFNSHFNAESEKTLYEALKRWINHDESRKKHFNELLEYIKLDCFSKDFLLSEAQSVCGAESGCLMKFIDAVKLTNENSTKCTSSLNTLIAIGGYYHDQSEAIEIYHLHLKKWIKISFRECARVRYSATLIGEKIIIIGGYENIPLKTVDYYDLRTGRKESLPQMKYTREHATAVTYGNNVYVFGGYDKSFLNNVEKWSQSTGTWQEVAPMKTPRDKPAAAVFDDEIFVVGGYGGGTVILTVTEAYNPRTNTWRMCSNMNEKREFLGLVSFGGFLYAVGGRDSILRISKTIERYDKKIDKWTMINSLDSPKYGIAAGNLNGKLIITGGENKTIETTVQTYNEKEDKWEKFPSLNQKRSIHCIVQVPWPLAKLALARED